MKLSKNKIHQYLFFFIISIYAIFNGGNSEILIQINLIFSGLLFLFCLKDKNYNLHLKVFYSKNRFSILFYLFFLLYLIFQTLPLPIESLKFFSPEKYDFIKKLNINISHSSISLAISNSFFQILNFLTLLIIIFILKMIFYTDRHKNRLYFFLSFIGFLSSLVAIIFYLKGNPDFLFLDKHHYKNSSTGFFINRTVFSIFLLFCLIASLEFIKNLDLKYNINQDTFFIKIYTRIFIIFITIGVITSFSRIGNFLLLITILFYLIREFFFIKNKSYSFRYIILLIILFDVFILGFYFGGSQIIDRFYFLKEEFSEIKSTNVDLTRFQIINFSISQLYDFWIFGYGTGSFETLFKIKFTNLNNSYADHAHADIIEFIGEFGIIGFLLFIFSLLKFFFNKKTYNFINLILITYLFFILSFDFSLHVPMIQILFIIFFMFNSKSTQSYY